jgi:hypothetical protein
VGADGVRVVALVEGEVGAVLAINLVPDRMAIAYAPSAVIKFHI